MATEAKNQQRRQRSSQEVRVPLIGAMTNRSASGLKDQRFLNIFPETRKIEAIESTRIFLNKRPGLTNIQTLVAGEARGMIYFNGYFLVVIGNTIYKTDLTTYTSLQTLTTSTGYVALYNADSSTYGDYCFVADGSKAYVVDSTFTVKLVDSTAIRTITITAAGSGYTNGTYNCSFSGGGGGSGLAATYTVTGNKVTTITITNKGTGYTSAPTVSFPSGGGSGATGTVILNAFPETHIPSISYIDGYILIAKGSDIYNCILDDPYSWDSGEYITAEMFPDHVVALGRQNNQVVAFGEFSTEFFYDAANTAGSPLNRNESTILQLGCAFPYAVYQNENSFIFVSQSNSGGRAIWKVDGFTPKKVSDEYIDRILDSESNPSEVRGFGFRVLGHLFYVINLPTINRTLVYDTEEKLWHEWSKWSGSDHNKFNCSYIADDGFGYVYTVDDTTGVIYKVDVSAYQDNGTTICSEIVTNRYDMDTYKRKFISNIRVIGDQEDSNSIDLRWTDDDYRTWSNWKTINTSDGFPNWSRLGHTRRRAFNLRHTLNKPLRLECLEVTFFEGES